MSRRGRRHRHRRRRRGSGKQSVDRRTGARRNRDTCGRGHDAVVPIYTRRAIGTGSPESMVALFHVAEHRALQMAHAQIRPLSKRLCNASENRTGRGRACKDSKMLLSSEAICDCGCDEIASGRRARRVSAHKNDQGNRTVSLAQDRRKEGKNGFQIQRLRDTDQEGTRRMTSAAVTAKRLGSQVKNAAPRDWTGIRGSLPGLGCGKSDSWDEVGLCG